MRRWSLRAAKGFDSGPEPLGLYYWPPRGLSPWSHEWQPAPRPDNIGLHGACPRGAHDWPPFVLPRAPTMLLPIYTPDNCRPAYRLYWSLSLFWKAPCPRAEDWSPSLNQVVEQDGVRILGHASKTLRSASSS